MNNCLTHFWPLFILTLRGSQVTARLCSSSTMQPPCYFAFLCSLSFLSSVLSLQCNDTQYLWPLSQPQLCCNKCAAGTYLTKRCSATSPTQCAPCIGNRYIDEYNVKISCMVCENCERPNMEYQSQCTTTHKAVCRCKAGYECRDQPCKQCFPILTSTKPTRPLLSTVLKPGVVTTPWTSPKPLRDTVWFLAIIALLSAGLVFLALTKIKPFLHWLASKYGYLWPKTHAPVSQDVDEEVSKPIQEAGNVTNPKSDLELGLLTNSQTVI